MNLPAPPDRADALAGRLRLSPGQPVPNIVSTRTELAARIAGGRSVATVPTLLGAVFTVCGGAHRIAARAAIAAATGAAPPASHETARTLQRETLREHLRRIWLDWPRVGSDIGLASEPVKELAGCPAMRSGNLEAMPAWLAAHAVGSDPERWLQRWDDDPDGWLDAWSRTATTHPARWLAAHRDDAVSLAAPIYAASVRRPGALETLATQLRNDPHFATAPLLDGIPADTGAWTRTNDTSGALPAAGARAEPISVWLRLGARLAELVRLGLPDARCSRGAGWLDHGAWSPHAGEGLGWVETARGLLLHWVTVSPGRDPADTTTVAHYRVIAPTDWSFHPHGVVARLLGSLDPQRDAARVALLVAAFDPCVDVQLACTEESRHA